MLRANMAMCSIFITSIRMDGGMKPFLTCSCRFLHPNYLFQWAFYCSKVLYLIETFSNNFSKYSLFEKYLAFYCLNELFFSQSLKISNHIIFLFQLLFNFFLNSRLIQTRLICCSSDSEAMN